MSDLIERDEAMDVLDDFQSNVENCVGGAYAIARQQMIDIPSARPKGEWISEGRVYPPTNGYHGAACSICGTESEYLTNFCGECGADMRKESE